MALKPCPFCTLPESRIVDHNELAVVINDGFPVSTGHTLIIPKRHVGSFFELNANEQHAMLALLKTTKAKLDQAHAPDSYNIGINDGPHAGQTIAHVHMHLIPRYQGDVEDPRGGVRWLIPYKADYWTDRTDRLDD
jgi:diadenosine tetraphosphate (Ap4A) HIT family hydrolase